MPQTRAAHVFISATIALASCTMATAQQQGMSSVRIDRAAHWLAPRLLAVRAHPDAVDFELQLAPESGALDRVGGYLESVGSMHQLAPLAPGQLGSYGGLAEQFMAMAPERPMTDEALREAVKGQILLIQRNRAGAALVIAEVQIAPLLDELFTAGANDADEVTDLGATVGDDGVRFRLWAPTARSVRVLLFGPNLQPQDPPFLSMTHDPATGIWTAQGPESLAQAFYQYEAELYHPQNRTVDRLVVTDPYSLSLSPDSRHSQVVDLNAPATAPDGWSEQARPTVDRFEDAIIYELHVRDFSIADSSLVNPELRGRYGAFGDAQSRPVQHLKSLRDAGLNHVQLLPVFDIASIPEDRERVIELDDSLGRACEVAPDMAVCSADHDPAMTVRALLASYPTHGPQAQALIADLRAHDAYNWGYDPFHYTVPEGSYAVDPDGMARIREFRAMVLNLHSLGLRVVMDVVYNHTPAHGIAPHSVLDQIVPGYYQRLNPITGAVENSTCCSNTATEHAMMGKLMLDSLEVWTRDYAIDGFRFDLMGHQPRALMLQALERIRLIDPDTYFYGEGWDFGEVANNRLFVQATQTELAGTEIGTFSDRLRDAIRGGAFNSMGDELRRTQGLGNGLLTFPNEMQPPDENRNEYLLSADQARIGLAGNLAGFPLIDAQGRAATGKDIPYGDGPTGYAADPADTINYVSKHDNQTLWDNNQYRIPVAATTAQRVRLQVLGLAFPLLAQGIPFIHMGSELLRSKSFTRDSYDWGDWFNTVDFSMRHNNYDVGLPPADTDEANWPLIRTLLEKSEGRDHVSPDDIALSAAVFRELLRIRSGSPLFRLATAAQIIERVSFHNTGPEQRDGLIVMHIDDSDFEADIDPAHESIVVIFNLNPEPRSVPWVTKRYALHPVQVNSADATVRNDAGVSKDAFGVPGLSVAVFVR